MDASPGPITATEIRQAGPDRLTIRWSDGAASEYPVRELRLACACAHCIDEWTGAAILEPVSVPEDVRPVQIAPSLLLLLSEIEGANLSAGDLERLAFLVSDL